MMESINEPFQALDPEGSRFRFQSRCISCTFLAEEISVPFLLFENY